MFVLVCSLDVPNITNGWREGHGRLTSRPWQKCMFFMLPFIAVIIAVTSQFELCFPPAPALSCYLVQSVTAPKPVTALQSRHSRPTTDPRPAPHWRKPNLYSEAIELVCGGSPIGCALVEWKAQHREFWEQLQHRTSLDQLFVQHKCIVLGQLNGNYLHLPYSILQGLSTLRGPPVWESRHR